MAERRPAPTAEETAAELEAWAKAFEGAKPVPPFTDDERAELNTLLLAAHEGGDADSLALLTELANDPARYRQQRAGFQTATP